MSEGGKPIDDSDDMNFLGVQRILMDVWDPIGVRGISGAEDEYDNYCRDVLRMLGCGDGYDEISDYLYRIATQHIEMPASVELKDRSRRAAREIVALQPTPSRH